jgi:hypothetical protein
MKLKVRSLLINILIAASLIFIPSNSKAEDQIINNAAIIY